MACRFPSSGDQKLIQIVDSALADVARRSGEWLVCRPGCTQCCIGVFPINQLDAFRLRRGLADLEVRAPERAAEVRQRAREAVARRAREFPGDPLTGMLDEGEEAEERFGDFANDEPCPALDPVTGYCELYESRPMTCRVFGPAVQSEDGLGVCELCFHGASDQQKEIQEMKQAGVVPGLAAVLVGDNPASQIYVRSKVKTCESLGLFSEKIEPPTASTTQDLLDLVDSLNNRDEIDGILIQLPLPPQVDSKKVLEAVDPAKDVDGFHPVNIGYLVSGRPGPVPCTPAGVIEIIKRSGVEMKGARAVVVGRSDIVGKPTAMLLMHNHATITICHSRTRDLPGVAREGDILVAAMGKAAYVTGNFIKPGAVVIDVGQNVLKTEEEVRRVFHDPTQALQKLAAKGQVLVGDVQPEDALEKAGAYTPVPGGVGPLTITMLMVNTVQAAKARRGVRGAAA